MAKQGLGAIDDELCPVGLVNLGPPPSPDDVHNASTTIAELPPQLLEALKAPRLRATEDMPSRPRPEPIAAWDGGEALLDLVERLDEDEPETLLQDTILIDADSIPSLVSAPADDTPPQTIELHVVRESSPLAAVETELARLPRPWVVAGALVASVSIAGVMALFCWTLVKLVF